jgi:hypothetical protein
MDLTVPYHASKKTGNDFDNDDLVVIEPSTSPTKCLAVKDSDPVQSRKESQPAPDGPPANSFPPPNHDPVLTPPRPDDRLAGAECSSSFLLQLNEFMA